jgi:hypothetical protein
MRYTQKLKIFFLHEKYTNPSFLRNQRLPLSHWYLFVLYSALKKEQTLDWFPDSITLFIVFFLQEIVNELN